MQSLSKADDTKSTQNEISKERLSWLIANYLAKLLLVWIFNA